MQTEQQNPQSANLDQLSIEAALHLMNAEDAAVAGAVAAVIPAITAAVDGIVGRLGHGGRLMYIGAGTRGRLGVLDAAECVPTFGVPAAMVQGIIAGGERAMFHAVEGAEDDTDQGSADLQARSLTANDAVVGIAASGRTPYVLGALAYANTIGAFTVGLACNAPAPVLDAAQVGIGVVVGPEVLTGSTRLKAGTAQKLVLNMLSTVSMVRLGKVYGNLMVDVQVTNQKLLGRAVRIVMQVTGADEPTAAGWLAQCSNSVKQAIVVGLLGVSPVQAAALLADEGGHLRRVIGDR